MREFLTERTESDIINGLPERLPRLVDGSEKLALSENEEIKYISNTLVRSRIRIETLNEEWFK